MAAGLKPGTAGHGHWFNHRRNPVTPPSHITQPQCGQLPPGPAQWWSDGESTLTLEGCWFNPHHTKSSEVMSNLGLCIQTLQISTGMPDFLCGGDEDHSSQRASCISKVPNNWPWVTTVLEGPQLGDELVGRTTSIIPVVCNIYPKSLSSNPQSFILKEKHKTELQTWI